MLLSVQATRITRSLQISQGVGVALLIDTKIDFEIISLSDQVDFEHLFVKAKLNIYTDSTIVVGD